jgi:hypothetical protein
MDQPVLLAADQRIDLPQRIMAITFSPSTKPNRTKMALLEGVNRHRKKIGYGQKSASNSMHARPNPKF